jgi:hypothetical protein
VKLGILSNEPVISSRVEIKYTHYLILGLFFFTSRDGVVVS